MSQQPRRDDDEGARRAPRSPEGEVAGGPPVSLASAPDDAALFELGQLIWSAISLEDFAYHMADAVGLDSYELKRGPVSECIKKVLAALRGWPESEIRERTESWLHAAQDALNERNGIVHAVPVTWVTIRDHTISPQAPGLEYLGRTRDSYRRFSLSEAGLRPVQQKLAAARAGWVEIYLALTEEHKRLSPAES